MIGKILGDRLFSSGIGGPFYSIKCSLTGFGRDIPFRFICPLLTPLTLILCFICPPAYAVIMSRAFPPAHGEIRQPVGLTVFNARGELLIAAVFWWFMLIAGYEVVSFVISAESEIYAKAARAGKSLQLATPEQMAYVTAVTRSYFALAFVLMLSLILSLTMSFAGLSRSVSPLKLTLRAVFVNLPGYICLLMVMLILFAFIEKEFSTLKIRHITGFMLGRKNFDPTWPFLILRIYLLGAFCAAAALCSALSLRLWVPFKNDEKK